MRITKKLKTKNYTIRGTRDKYYVRGRRVAKKNKEGVPSISTGWRWERPDPPVVPFE